MPVAVKIPFLATDISDEADGTVQSAMSQYAFRAIAYNHCLDKYPVLTSKPRG